MTKPPYKNTRFTYEKSWFTQAQNNVDKWGEQSVNTLILCLNEELGEFTQTYLQYNSDMDNENADIQDMYNELNDIAALIHQLYWALESGHINEVE